MTVEISILIGPYLHRGSGVCPVLVRVKEISCAVQQFVNYLDVKLGQKAERQVLVVKLTHSSLQHLGFCGSACYIGKVEKEVTDTALIFE